MSGNKRIVLALRGIREGRQTFELPVGMKAVATTGENLMRVSLMTYVPQYSMFYACLTRTRTNMQIKIGDKITTNLPNMQDFMQKNSFLRVFGPFDQPLELLFGDQKCEF